jgi:hypothetical protein
MSDVPAQGPGRQRLSEWLQLMLGEIERKRQDLDAADAERLRRAATPAAPPTTRE